MKKKLLIIVPALLFGLSSLTYAVNGGNEKQQVVAEINQGINESVKKELSSFLEIIPVSMEKEHGFNDRAEFAKAVPASIYRIVGVDKEGNTFETNLYNVVVAVDGEYRAVLTVSSDNGKYEIQTIGAALMARELQVLEKSNPLPSNNERIMLNVYSKSAGFVAFHDANASVENADLIPLESAKSGLTNSESRVALQSTYKLTEAVHALGVK
jgi:hypothetical protein